MLKVFWVAKMTQGRHFYFSLLDSFDKEQTLHRCKSEALQEQVKQWTAACISFFSHVCELFYKVDDMVEGLEQELEGITDSGDFAAYQVHDLFVQMSTSQDMLTDPSDRDHIMILMTLPPFRNSSQITLELCFIRIISCSPRQGETWFSSSATGLIHFHFHCKPFAFTFTFTFTNHFHFWPRVYRYLNYQIAIFDILMIMIMMILCALQHASNWEDRHPRAPG